MKKFLSLVLAVAVMAAMLIPSGFAVSAYKIDDNESLLQLANLFNSCSIVDHAKSTMGYEFTATVSGNDFNVAIVGSDTNTNSKYVLDGNILSTKTGSEDFMAIYAVIIVGDCVGQLNGYADGETFDTLNSDEISDYTVENEGFEFKEVADGYEVKMDITKKIPLIDASKVFITADDLDEEIVASDEGGSVNGIKISVAYYVSINPDGKNEIYIAQKDAITESTYKSILSVIEVMFGDEKAVEYFTDNYADIAKGNKKFVGFKIEVDTENDIESELFEGKLITKVSVDKKLVKKYLEAIETATYKYIEGAGQTYTKGGTADATFKIEVDYVLFENGGAVYVDDELLSADKYTSAPGSTVITLNRNYLDTLSAGEHTIKVAFAGGEEAATSFNIAYGTDAKSPKTGENANVLYLVLMISLLGMALTVKKIKV